MVQVEAVRLRFFLWIAGWVGVGGRGGGLMQSREAESPQSSLSQPETFIMTYGVRLDAMNAERELMGWRGGGCLCAQ